MSTEFVFTGMKAVFQRAVRRNDPTIAFELREGAGRFVFLLFCSRDDIGGAQLFIYLPRIDRVLSLKPYGKLWDGVFRIYFRPDQVDDMKRELNLRSGLGTFDFPGFLERLNLAIPQDLPPSKKLGTLREVWPRVAKEASAYVDKSDHTVLTGIMHLPEGKAPRDQTLRKLYFFTDSDAAAIDDFIERLRRSNVTLVWDKEPEDGRVLRRPSFAELISRI